MQAVIHVVPKVTPGPIDTSTNQIDIPTGGQYTLNLMPADLDVMVLAPAASTITSPDWGLLAIDMMTGFAAAPFPNPEPKVRPSAGLGPCV